MQNCQFSIHFFFNHRIMVKFWVWLGKVYVFQISKETCHSYFHLSYLWTVLSLSWKQRRENWLCMNCASAKGTIIICNISTQPENEVSIIRWWEKELKVIVEQFKKTHSFWTMNGIFENNLDSWEISNCIPWKFCMTAK